MSHNRTEEEQEDLGETWIPLSRQDDQPSNISLWERTHDESTSHCSSAAGGIHIKTENPSNNLQMIQRKLETRIAIQDNLVNHPIDLFWKRFLFNLLREIWSLEPRMRLGLVLLAAGFVTRCFVWSFWYVFYPKVALLSMILLGSFMYVDPFEIQKQVKTFGDIFLSPERLAQTLEKLDIQQLRKYFGLIFLFPTFLEMRTLSFLSQIKAETGWTLYNLLLGTSILARMMYLMRRKRMQPREATYQGMLILYGSALLVSIFTFNVRRMPFVAAPFLTATGTLLLTYNDNDMEWISRIVRYSLRVTLKDVLSSVGTRVNQDEMLQLAILRWISDFWASNPGAAASAYTGGSHTGQHKSAPQADAHSNSPAPSSGGNQIDVANHNAVGGSSTASRIQQRDVQWDELLPMLNVEIDHMEAEVEELQSKDTEQPVDGSKKGASTGSFQNQQKENKNGNNTHAFDDLKSMLLSLNVDDRAEPAVMAYRRSVESFPPQKRTAFLISLLRRNPAMLTMIFHVVFGGTTSLISSCIILSPFVIMEYFRITLWISRCQLMPNGSPTPVSQEQPIDKMIPKELAAADPMTILLCGDSHPALSPPTLLLVWHNIVSSVSALEFGLTAARCAETTAVAVQFAENIISLAQLGFEVSQHGLLHGIGIVLKEALTVGGDFSNLDGMDDDTARYTKAALGALHSGQRVARNIQRLGEDEHVGAIVQPVLIALGFLSGQGWLRAKDNAPVSNDGSQNVVIEELNDDEVDLSQQINHSGGVGDSPRENEQNEVSSLPSSNDPRYIESSRTKPQLQSPSTVQTRSKADNSVESCEDPHIELSTVMDMIAHAYEQNLIEESEKADFYEKLSKLRKEELSDPSVLLSMKRKLGIILENGCTVSIVDAKTSEEVLGRNPVENNNDIFTLDNEHEESNFDEIQTVDEEPMNQSAAFAEEVLQPEAISENGSNDALLRFGAAAVGVLAGGLLISMSQRDRGTRDHEGTNNYHHNTTQADDQEENWNQQSSVVIEELNDDNDDDWISVPQ
jgi:hypothetical protein